MNTKRDIEMASLLEKFYEGETTLREERILKDYFKGEIPVDLEVEGAYFDYLKEAKEEGSQRTAIHFMEPVQPSKRSWKKPLLMAASIALIFSLGGIAYMNQQSESKGMIVLQNEQDMELAYQETQKALFMISRQLRKGEKGATELARLDQVVTDVKHIQQ